MIGAASMPRRPHLWRHLPGNSVSAGLFYLGWQSPEATGVASAQWPFAIAALTVVASAAQRSLARTADAGLRCDHHPGRRQRPSYRLSALPVGSVEVSGASRGRGGPTGQRNRGTSSGHPHRISAPVNPLILLTRPCGVKFLNYEPAARGRGSSLTGRWLILPVVETCPNLARDSEYGTDTSWTGTSSRA